MLKAWIDSEHQSQIGKQAILAIRNYIECVQMRRPTPNPCRLFPIYMRRLKIIFKKSSSSSAYVCQRNVSHVGQGCGLVPIRHQAITWPIGYLMAIEPLWTVVSEIRVKIHKCICSSCKKCRLQKAAHFCQVSICLSEAGSFTNISAQASLTHGGRNWKGRNWPSEIGNNCVLLKRIAFQNVIC